MRRHEHKPPTGAAPAWDSPAGEDIGLAAPPLPGGEHPIIQAPAKPEKLAVPVQAPYFSGDMAHGVYAAPGPARQHESVHHHNQASGQAKPEQRKPQPDPVPVYIVEEAGGAAPLAKIATSKITVGVEPVVLCGRDRHRSLVQILNEPGQTNSGPVRISESLSDLAVGGGAVLPGTATSYTRLRTQDILYAVSGDANSHVVSVVLELDLPGAG